MGLRFAVQYASQVQAGASAMSNQTPIDLQPEYQHLVLQSSSVGLLARFEEAKGEPFEAAVLWAEAGRVHAELGDKLIQDTHLERPVCKTCSIPVGCVPGNGRPASG